MNYSVTGAAIFRAVGLALIFVTVTAKPSAVFAQALKPDSPWNPPAPKSAKSVPAKRKNPCSAYGAGFVNIPGSDGCIKIGGFVTIESTANPGR